MRNILFRGKLKFDNDNNLSGDFVYGDFVRLKDGHIEKPYIYSKGEVILDTVGQFVGLDSKGNQIFEGDIVEFTSHGYTPLTICGSVIYKDGAFCIEYDFYGKRYHNLYSTSTWQDMGASGIITYTYEVIGNIYDNIDLLSDNEYLVKE